MVPKTYTIPIQENHLGVKKFTIAANLFELLCRFRAQTAHSKIIFINDTIVLLAQYYEKRAWVRSYKFTVDKTEPPEKQMEKQIKTIAINVFFVHRIDSLYFQRR